MYITNIKVFDMDNLNVEFNCSPTNDMFYGVPVLIDDKVIGIILESNITKVNNEYFADVAIFDRNNKYKNIEFKGYGVSVFNIDKKLNLVETCDITSIDCVYVKLKEV